MCKTNPISLAVAASFLSFSNVRLSPRKHELDAPDANFVMHSYVVHLADEDDTHLSKSYQMDRVCSAISRLRKILKRSALWSKKQQLVTLFSSVEVSIILQELSRVYLMSFAQAIEFICSADQRLFACQDFITSRISNIVLLAWHGIFEKQAMDSQCK